jgi:hypothetical protein
MRQEIWPPGTHTIKALQKPAQSKTPKPVKYYLAGAFNNRANIATISRLLETLHPELTCTFKWWEEEEKSAMGGTEATRQRIAGLEINAVQKADVFFIVGPVRLGASTELGAALALHIPVFAWLPTEDEYLHNAAHPGFANIFMFHHAVRRTWGPTALDQLSAVYRKWRAEAGPGRISEEALPVAFVHPPQELGEMPQPFEIHEVGRKTHPRTPPSTEPFLAELLDGKLPPFRQPGLYPLETYAEEA